MPTIDNKNYISNKYLGALNQGKTYQYYDKSPELELVLSRAVAEGYTVPSTNTQVALDQLIKSMKADGTWYKEDTILNFTYNNAALSNFSLINLKNPWSITNLVTFSKDWSNASWANQLGTAIKTPNTTDTLAPDGSQTACKWTDSVGTDTAVKANVISNATTVTFSLYVKAGTSITKNFLLRNNTTATNFTAGTFNFTTNTISGAGWTSTSVGNGWYRISYTQSTGINVGDNFWIYPGGFGGAPTAGSWYVWGVQVEDRDKVSRYLPTGSTAIFGNGIATVKGAMTYTVNGWQSNGATGATAAYIETKFNPSVTGRNYTLNNAGRGCVVYKANTTAQTRWLDFSRLGLPNAPNLLHINQVGQSSTSSRINSNTLLTSPLQISSLGFKGIYRDTATTLSILQQSTQNNYTNNSSTIGTSEFILFNNIPDGNLSTDAGMSIWTAGASKTFAETQNFRTYYNSYLTKIGLTAIA